ncbi:zinc-activated ligand-gated ion channel [Lacerta agilis]|uniref:zinc-activated ligand-gated ion channel n=1 Tax=Lacerta agilis TaxID=80427 RepID=UPI001419F130|nr:zinc-activated ligand-gated ion channel [Lacerta agilis]
MRRSRNPYCDGTFTYYNAGCDPYSLMAALPQMTWQDSINFLEVKLLESLLNTYSPSLMPRNGTGPLVVDVNIQMSNVLHVDIMQYTISSVLVLYQSWYAEQLAWNETKFPFTTITVPWGSVWTPSLTVKESQKPIQPCTQNNLTGRCTVSLLANAITDRTPFAYRRFEVTWKTESPPVVLHSDGKVEFALSLRIDSNCNFDLLYYPRDSTRCTLSFSSLANTVNELEFNVSIQNQILNLKREYLVTDVKVSSLKNLPQPCFVVMVNLENTGMRVVLSVIVPSLALVVADLCGFLIPLKDRLAYMITLLLAYLVFHSSLVGSLPGSSSCNPLLSYYYISLLVLLFLSTTETVLVTKLVTDNSNLWLNCGCQWGKAKATTMVPKDQSNNPEHTKDPGTSDCGTTEESSHLKQASAHVDRLCFIIYFVLVVVFHLLFAALWLFWKCESGKPPGEDYLDGIKWEQK